MKRLSVSETKNSLSALLSAVRRGETVLVTHLGKPFARLRHCGLDLCSPTHQTRIVSMTTASISELKANLSRYVNEVRRGGEVQILDRGRPVAKLVPATVGEDPKALDRLVRRGLIRPGKGDPAEVLKEPPLELPVSILDALLEDRDDRL